MIERGTLAGDAHLLGRLESFSDLVFGFVVPMMAVNVKVPTDPAHLSESRKGLVVFAAGFLLLCTLWLRHHRMMRRFFVPRPVGILIVFAILGIVALYAYPLQLYLRFPNDPLALRAYLWGISILSVAYLTMALYARKVDGPGWEPRRAFEARRAIVANGVVGAAMFAYPFAVERGWAVLAIPLFAIVAFRLAAKWIAGGKTPPSD